jgi:anti-sigma B factor antagonist
VDNLTITTDEAPGLAPCVTIDGEATVYTCAQLKDELRRLVEAGQHHIAIDARRCAYIDSAGLAVLVGARRRLESLRIVGTAAVIRPLEITRISKVIDVHADLDAARALPPAGSE